MRLDMSQVYHEPNTGCWLWGGTLALGYGRQSNKMAHRISHEEFIGPIPEGWVVDHLCMQKCCVNPDHLQAVLRAENSWRYWHESRVRRSKSFASTECRQKTRSELWEKYRRYLRPLQEKRQRLLAELRDVDQSIDSKTHAMMRIMIDEYCPDKIYLRYGNRGGSL
jgi:hypothetical protein